MRTIFILPLGLTWGCLPFDDGYYDYDPAILDGQNTTGDPAVAFVDLGRGGCTGTLVSPRVIVTAAHCLQAEGVTDISAKFVNNRNEQGATHNSTVNAVVQGTDLGLIALAEPSAVKPMPYNMQPLDAYVGQQVRVVGFGVTAEVGGGAGQKRVAYSTLLGVNAGQYQGMRDGEMAASNNNGGTCYGDSGGPNFMTLNGVEYLVGATSRGNAACGSGQDISVRTDAYANAIA